MKRKAPAATAGPIFGDAAEIAGELFAITSLE